MNLIAKLKDYSRLDYINYLILIYAFVLSFPDEIKRVVAILLILLWITDRTKYDFKLPKTNLFKAFGIFILFSLLSYFWSSASFIEVLDIVKRYWHCIPAFIMFKYLKKNYLSMAISSFLLGILSSEILSYGNFFGFWEIGHGHIGDPTVFYNHIIYSIMLACASMLLLAKIIYEKSKKHRLMYLLFYTTVTINILINAGRTGQIALFCTFIIIIFYMFRKRIKYLLSIIAILSLILILSYKYNPVFNKRINAIKHDITHIVENNNYSTSIGGRIGFWILSKELISENPILGTGLASNLDEAKKLVDSKLPYLHFNKSLNHFHSDYLEILTSLGIVGFLLFFYLIYQVLNIRIKNRELKLVKFSILSIFIFSALADLAFYRQGSLGILTFFIGIFLVQYRIEYYKKQ